MSARADLEAELTAMWAEDQRLSSRVTAAARKDPALRRIFLFELPQEEWPEGYAACRVVAHRNVLRLAEIVEAAGWPTPSVVGAEAAAAAWGIAQHADGDNELRRSFLPLLEAAVAHGEPVGEHLAALTDRVALADGRPQRFGTLVQDRDDRWVLREPVEDGALLDERRAAVGIGTWRDWIARMPSPSVLYGD